MSNVTNQTAPALLLILTLYKPQLGSIGQAILTKTIKSKSYILSYLMKQEQICETISLYEEEVFCGYGNYDNTINENVMSSTGCPPKKLALGKHIEIATHGFKMCILYVKRDKLGTHNCQIS